MKYGYIRLSKTGPSLKEQRSALSLVGFPEAGPIFVDEIPKGRSKPDHDALPQRSEAIRSLSANDELVIANAARLGTSVADILAALVAVGQKRASIFEVATGATIRWHPDAQEAVAFIERAESNQRREVTAKMRATKVAMGMLGGAPVKLTGESLKEAERLWANPELTAAQVAEKTGVSERTLYRKLGERGTPRFGGRRSK